MRGNGSKLAAIAITVVTVVTWLWTVIARDLTQRYTRGERPGQFSGSLDSDLLDDYGLVFGIAHNAGDHIETAQTAIDHNADAVEIDVVLIRGQLYAAHAAPQRIAAWLFQGTLLEDSWQIAIQADAVALDLKDETSEYEDAVVNFIEQHPHEPIVLYSRSIDSLSRLRELLPDVHLYLSVPDRATFDETMPNHPFAPRLDGVTIQHDAIDASVVATIRANNQRIIAWTVNDLPRVNELVRLGVDGITSDNLAILRLLGGRQRVEPLLTRRVMSDE